MTGVSAPLVVVHADKEQLSDASGARLLLALADAQAARGVAHAVLTGGSMGSAVLASAGAASFRDLVDWRRVHFWWGDERFLPYGDPDRNDTQNRAALLDALPLLAEQVHAVAGPDLAPTPQDSAREYAGQLARAAWPVSRYPTSTSCCSGSVRTGTSARSSLDIRRSTWSTAPPPPSRTRRSPRPSGSP